MITLAFYYAVCDIVLFLQCLIYHRQKLQVDPKHLSPATPLLEPTPESRDLAYSEIENASIEPLNKPPKWRSLLFNGSLLLAVCTAGVLGWLMSDSKTDSHGEELQLEFNFLGQFFGYLCAFFYLGSRVPQLLLNYRRKSCEGISFLFFMFACLGNSMFVISILVLSSSPKYLFVNAPWLLGSFGTLVQDFIIFTQFWIYNEEGAQID